VFPNDMCSAYTSRLNNHYQAWLFTTAKRRYWSTCYQSLYSGLTNNGSRKYKSDSDNEISGAVADGMGNG